MRLCIDDYLCFCKAVPGGIWGVWVASCICKDFVLTAVYEHVICNTVKGFASCTISPGALENLLSDLVMFAMKII